MRRTTRRACAILLAPIFVIAVTSCGEGTPSSPSPTPGGGPTPGPSPSPSGLSLSSLSLSQSSVAGQSQPIGTITLTGNAPSTGVVVQLSSSNPTVAQVPSTVTVAGGQSGASFTVSTSTVPNSTSSTITASYGGTSRSAALTVLSPQLDATFSVASPTKGNDACVFGPGTDEADCVLDASASRGFIHQYLWTYWTGSTPIGHTTEQPRSALQLDSECAFFENGRGGDDASANKYVQMTIELVVQDRVGTRSAPMRRAVRLYPNRLCGFNY